MQRTFFKTMEHIEINIINVVGDPICVAADDGQKVFERIIKIFNEEKKVSLSFLNVAMLTTAFLNTAIGQLYKDHSEEFVKANLTVQDISQSGLVSLKRTVDTAKLYYKDPEAMERSVREILGE